MDTGNVQEILVILCLCIRCRILNDKAVPFNVCLCENEHSSIFCERDALGSIVTLAAWAAARSYRFSADY